MSLFSMKKIYYSLALPKTSPFNKHLAVDNILDTSAEELMWLTLQDSRQSVNIEHPVLNCSYVVPQLPHMGAR